MEVEKAFGSELWRAVDSDGLVVLGQSEECVRASYGRLKGQTVFDSVREQIGWGASMSPAGERMER